MKENVLAVPTDDEILEDTQKSETVDVAIFL